MKCNSGANRLRHILLEALEKRELLAADLIHPVYAEGTPTSYMDDVDTSISGGPFGAATFQGSRWTDPVGGPSPNEGDPATITWSIVPDGTPVPDVEGNLSASDLITFMDNIYGGGGATVADRPWFGIFERAYDRWSEVSGLNFVYCGYRRCCHRRRK